LFAPAKTPAPGGPSSPGTPESGGGKEPGRPTPAGTPGPKEDPSGGEGEPAKEAGKTTEADKDPKDSLPLKPTLLFFLKRHPADGKPYTPDEQEKATSRFYREIFSKKEIIDLAREFICIRVDVAKIAQWKDKLPYRASKAPAIALLDLKEKVVYRTEDPKLLWQTLAKALATVLKKVEGEVKRIARGKEETPEVLRAKARVIEIEMREEYRKAFDFVVAMRWSQAEKRFEEILKRAEENEWKARAKNGAKEIEAGKLVEEAQKALRKRRKPEAKSLLTKALEVKGAYYYSQKARELLDSF